MKMKKTGTEPKQGQTRTEHCRTMNPEGPREPQQVGNRRETTKHIPHCRRRPDLE